MAHELQLIKHHTGILIPATPETSDILQSKIKLGDVLVAEFKKVRNPAFHRRFFALLNLGFDYWEPTGGTISSNERKLVTGYEFGYSEHHESVYDRERYLEKLLAAIKPVTRAEAIEVCRWFLESEKAQYMENHGAAVILNLVGECEE
ncbi:DUF1367 family protein [Escherichia coli]|nr:DUF1367 family protein [Escherichia coli]MPU29103.1 DUF1367 family protein [Escherichia coli]MPU39490.1 DUF1367 family protein [Escherichia coli]